MRCYFNQKESKQVNVFVYIDDMYYGKIQAKEKCVTSVDLPDTCKQIRFSFSDAYEDEGKVHANTTTDSWDAWEYETKEDAEGEELEDVENEESKDVEREEPEDEDKLESLEHSDISFGYESSVAAPVDEMSNRRWQFPYDIEFDATVYTEDLVFYPVAFERSELEGGIYYQGRSVETGNLIEMKLKKRVKNFDMDTWRTLYLGVSAIALILCTIGLPYFCDFYVSEYLENQEYYDMTWNGRAQPTFLGRIVICFFGIITSIVVFSEKWNYKGMFREQDMKEEYVVTLEGEVVEIPSVEE